MCSIDITSVIGIISGGSLTSIEVEGTATDCKEIEVRLECSQGGDVQDTTVGPTGNWSVSFTTVACQCDEKIGVVAICKTDPTCVDEFNDPLPCQEEPGDDCCPIIDAATADVGECRADGQVTVTFDGAITVPTGCTPTIVQWDFGDGSASSAMTFTTAGAITLPSVTHDYPGDGSSVTARLQVVFPLSCAERVVTFDLPECEVESHCPDFEQVEDVGVCDDEGNRPVSVTVTLTLPGETITAELKQGSTVLDSGTNTGTLVLSHSGSYPAGTNQTFTVSTSSPTGCGDHTFSVALPACAVCPEPSQDITFGDCDDAGNRSVSVDVTLTLPGETITAELKQGSTVLDSGTNTGALVLSHSGSYPAGTNQTFTVSTSNPTGCGDYSFSVAVPDCEPDDGGTGDDGDGSPSFCGAMTFIIAALFAVAAAATVFLAALATCPAIGVTVPSWAWYVIAGLWIAAGVAVAVSYLLCALGICPCLTRCDWLVIAWMTALAAAVVALYLLGCCSGLWWLVAAGLGAVAIGAFLWWVAECRPSTCQVLDYLLVAFASVTATALAYIALVPAIAACGLAWVAAAVATIVAGLAIAVTACHAAE